jgi:hypothetical protein
VSLCVIYGIIPNNIKIKETGKFYEITKGIGTQYDREMEMENWKHPATNVKITEGYEESSHPIQAYTDGSKNDLGVGAGIAIFLDNNLTASLKYTLNGRCTNNQAEQMAILKALEYIRYTESGEKISTSKYRQQDNTSIATKPEETNTPHRTNQN